MHILFVCRRVSLSDEIQGNGNLNKNTTCNKLTKQSLTINKTSGEYREKLFLFCNILKCSLWICIWCKLCLLLNMVCIYDICCFDSCIQDRHHGISSPAVDGHQEHLQFSYQEEQADLQHRKTLLRRGLTGFCFIHTSISWCYACPSVACKNTGSRELMQAWIKLSWENERILHSICGCHLVYLLQGLSCKCFKLLFMSWCVPVMDELENWHFWICISVIY